jgi:hypothetical protein
MRMWPAAALKRTLSVSTCGTAGPRGTRSRVTGNKRHGRTVTRVEGFEEIGNLSLDEAIGAIGKRPDDVSDATRIIAKDRREVRIRRAGAERA